jgi:hypothetical protein
MGLSITVGLGRQRPQGEVVPLPDTVPPARALADALNAIPATGERWWSAHDWSGGHRGTERWRSSSAVQIDLDHEDAKGDHCAPTPEVAATVRTAAELGLLPGSLMHLTPRGARIVFVFRAPVSDRELYSRAAQGAADKVAAALGAAGLPLAAPGRAGYHVDGPALLDFARLLFAPRCVVDGVRRDASVLVMREEGYEPRDLAPPARVMTLVSPAAMEIGDAVAAYNREHPRVYPKSGSGDCPVCSHKGCFGGIPDSEGSKWACFSANHAGAGKKSTSCWVGDALDLDAWEAKRSPIEHLRACGNLAPAKPTPPQAASSGGGQPATVTPIRSERDRLLKSNSYGSCTFILRTPELREKVLGRGVLEFNELTLAVTINRRPVVETDYLRVRELCETELGESEDKGYKFSRSDIEDGVRQVAHERRFHPVRDYLRSNVWDGVQRIDSIAEDVLGVPRTDLTNTLIRKWLISAVARVEQPGVKADGVLILVGPGGVGKSSFFKILASAAWFGDTAMDLNDKNDAYLKLHTTWIYEWGELESMQRARSVNTVKGFISSAEDRFRAPYAREMELHARRFVLCGTTNEREILTEGRGGGDRRYWIVETPSEFNFAKLAEWRDQIWAEAFAAYTTGEEHGLTKAEEADLERFQEAFVKRDPWEDRIRAWASQHKITETKISAVLVGAIDKKIEHWTDRDEQRVGRVLKAMSWERRRKMADGVRDYVYVDPTVAPF